MNKTETGAYGERLAEKALKKAGLVPLERNYRAGKYEIDLVMRDRKTKEIVFVEVKARSTDAVNLPRTAVIKQKQTFLKSAARQYLLENDEMAALHRFDIVEVWLEDGRTAWLENAF